MRADSVPAAASLAFLVAVQVPAPAGLTGGGGGRRGGGAGGGAARAPQAQPQETAASLREATAGDAARPEPHAGSGATQGRGPGGRAGTTPRDAFRRSPAPAPGGGEGRGLGWKDNHWLEGRREVQVGKSCPRIARTHPPRACWNPQNARYVREFLCWGDSVFARM